MYILKHEISISMFYNKERQPVFQKDLDTVEKIQKFQPEFYQGAKKLKIKKETKKSYIVIEIDEDGEETELCISKIYDGDRIMLNRVIYPNSSFSGIECELYTLDIPEEIIKGKEEVIKYYKNIFAIKAATNENLLETLEQNILK
jgi:hypothetical protein